MLFFSFKFMIISDLLDDTQGAMLSLCVLDKSKYLKTLRILELRSKYNPNARQSQLHERNCFNYRRTWRRKEVRLPVVQNLQQIRHRESKQFPVVTSPFHIYANGIDL